MNHSIALSRPPRERILNAIMQYLQDERLVESMELLQRESGVKHAAPLEGQEDHLVTALMDYEARQNTFSDKKELALKQSIENAVNRLHLVEKRDNTATGTKQLQEWKSFSPHAANILCVALEHNGQAASKSLEELTELYLISGGVDKRIVLTNIIQEDVVKRFDIPAPPLTLDFMPQASDNPLNRRCFAAGCMNGSCYLFQIDQNEPILTLNDHRKYVVVARFSPSGKYLATGSHDGTVCIYELVWIEAENDENIEEPRESELIATRIVTVEYQHQVESLAWLQDDHCIVCPREDNHLHVVSTKHQREIGRLNVNKNGDDHVSFSNMHISISHSGEFMAIATDQHRLMILSTEISELLRQDISTLDVNVPVAIAVHIRDYYGLVNDGYSNPRTCWSPLDRYVYISNQDKTICEYDVALGKATSTIRGHEVNIRDLISSNHSHFLATCSFDRSIKIWKEVESTNA